MARISGRSDQLANELCWFIRKVPILWRPFWPACRRNVVAVPVPAPETWNLLRTMPRLRAVAEDADAAFVLTTRKIFNMASASGSNLWDFEGTPWIVTDELEEGDSDLGAEPIEPTTPAYFQYTSGSTSSPSGVVITHQNLMHHLGALHKSCGYGERRDRYMDASFSRLRPGAGLIAATVQWRSPVISCRHCRS